MSKLVDVRKRRATKAGTLKATGGGLDAVAPNRLLRINTNVARAIVKVRGAVARLRKLLPRIVNVMPDFDPRQLDELERRAAALADAEGKHRLLRGARKAPKELLADGLTMRAQLLADIRALMTRRLIAEKAVARLRGGNAYRHVARDLLLLTSLFRGNDKAVQGRCATTTEELDRAEAIAGQLIDWTRERDVPTRDAAAAALTRARAFTLLSRSYAEVRRVIQYVRFHEGDAHLIVPPLSGTRKRKRRKYRKSPPLEAGASGEASESR